MPRSSRCSATAASRPCALTAASVSPTSAARCARRSGSTRATSSSSPSATSRTTRATSSSSTRPTRPEPSSRTASSPSTPRSTRPTPSARARTAKPTSSSAMPTPTRSRTRAARRRSTSTTSEPVPRRCAMPCAVSSPASTRGGAPSRSSRFCCRGTHTVFSLKPLGHSRPDGSHDSNWSGGWTAVVGETSRLVMLFTSLSSRRIYEYENLHYHGLRTASLDRQRHARFRKLPFW